MSLTTLVYLAILPGLQAPQPAEPAQSQKLRHNSNRAFQLADLKAAKVTMDGHKFDLWVMDTNAKRMEGMMFVENSDFKDNQGMIFIFPSPDYQRFWMKNTIVPLDIAYVGSDNRILNTYTMKALDTTTDYSSWGRSAYVIEVRAGLFRKLGIGRGDKVEIPKNLKAED